LAKALAEGRHLENPKRYRDRSEPTTDPLGDPSRFLKDLELVAWECFRREVHWLTEADRRLVKVASRLQAKVWDGGSMQAVTTLLRCLSLMGATPTDRSKVFIPPAESTDPAEEFLN
jgi:hypothetical protein